jgi:acetyl esterase/lipase
MRSIMTFILIPMILTAAEPITIDLWPGKPPGEPSPLKDAEKTERGPKDSTLRTSNVSIPQLNVTLPAKDKATGVFVLIAPGGGYTILAIEHEGSDVAKFLNDRGIAAGVLKYRVPRREGVTPPHTPMLQDAQRAMAIIRSKASDWGIDASKVGMIGFSAGGHLTAMTSLTAKRAYEAIDAADSQPTVPNFSALVYAGGLIETGKSELKSDLAVTAKAPPMFFVHAFDDRVTVENSLQMYRALKTANVPSEMHLYASGGHGFGMRKGHAAEAWPERYVEWLKTRGVIK